MTIKTTADLAREGTALLAKQNTPALVNALTVMGPQITAARATANITRADEDYSTAQALNLARMWIIEVLEHRHPEAAAEVEKFFETVAEDADVDYDAVLLAHIPTDGS